MATKLIDHPKFVDLDQYDRVIARLTRDIRKQPGVSAIYQIGSVSNPGISDVDMVVVFDDDAACDYSPRANLDTDERYLVVHGLFGAAQTWFRQAHRYSFFHNYHLLWGDETEIPPSGLSHDQETRLKHQIALEYLLKMYIDSAIEQAYRMLKVRSVLLHIKGIRYDLEFLGISSGTLWELTNQMIEQRQRWFDAPLTNAQFLHWMNDFNAALEPVLREKMNEHGLLLPEWARTRIAGNMELQQSTTLKTQHNGFVLPGCLSFLGKKFFNAQHRLNRFAFDIPWQIASDPDDIIYQRFEFLRRMQAYNRTHTPHFTPFISSLNIY